MLEIAGILVFLLDVRTDRAKARHLLMIGYGTGPTRYPEHLDIPSGDSDRAKRERLARFRNVIREVDKLERRGRWVSDATRKAVADLLDPGSTWKLLRGPTLLIVGVLIGTAANIAAS